MHTTKQLRFSVLPVSPPHAMGGWRMPGAEKERMMDFAFFKELAEQAEAAKIDMLFIADKYTTSGTPLEEHFHRRVNGWPEPFTLLSSLIGVTKRIGLSLTASTTYWEPFHIARMFASMDHLSGGRASWNIVSSRGDLEAHNFKHMPDIPINQRQERSEEFVEVVKSLWESWDADAIVADAEHGAYTRPGAIRKIDHRGTWFTVDGPLNVPRPPQQHPVLVQAGESSRFKEWAARGADVVFTALSDLGQAQAFYTDLKSRAVHHGRRPEDILLLPGLSLTVGDSKSEAEEKDAYYHGAMSGRAQMEHLSGLIGADVRERSLSDALPEPSDETQEKYKAIYEEAKRLGIDTLAQLQQHMNRKGGHLKLVGTPIQIADQMQKWLEEQGSDGYTYIPSYLPGGLRDLGEKVIPELQNRGIFKTEYAEGTLREQLGLGRAQLLR